MNDVGSFSLTGTRRQVFEKCQRDGTSSTQPLVGGSEAISCVGLFWCRECLRKWLNAADSGRANVARVHDVKKL